jgi:hypothetical protein
MFMSDDVLAGGVTTAQTAKWGPIEALGLRVEADDAKVHEDHERYVRDGQFMTYSSGDAVARLGCPVGIEAFAYCLEPWSRQTSDVR